MHLYYVFCWTISSKVRLKEFLKGYFEYLNILRHGNVTKEFIFNTGKCCELHYLLLIRWEHN